MATRLAAAAQPVRADFFDRLAQFNLVVTTGDFAMKVYRAFLKAKQSGLNEAVKGDVCSFKMDSRLDYLLVESQKHSLKMNYITEMIEHVAKHFGCPRPPAPSKEGANVKNGNGGKSEGNGGGAKGNGGGANGDGGDLPEPVDFFGGF